MNPNPAVLRSPVSALQLCVLSVFVVFLPHAGAITLTDIRNLKVFADTPEERSHAQWLFNDGQSLQSLGAPWMPDMHVSYGVNSDSSGGLGSALAYAKASQVSSITDDLFSGTLGASASARASAST